MEIQIEDFWWEESTLCIKQKDTQEIHRFQNCYPTNLHFVGLECDTTELCTIEATKSYQNACARPLPTINPQ